MERDQRSVSGEHSRFRRDPALTRSQFEAMYRAWVRNSVNKEVADDVLVGCGRRHESFSKGAQRGIFVQIVHGLAPPMTMMGTSSRERRAGPVRLIVVFLNLKKST